MESNKENLNVDHESETMIYLQRFLFCLLVVSEKVFALFQSCGFYVARTRGDLERTYFSISFNYYYYCNYFFFIFFEFTLFEGLFAFLHYSNKALKPSQ